MGKNNRTDRVSLRTTFRVDTAIIPVGGPGGRMHAVTADRFMKVNIPVLGKPMVGHLLAKLKAAGVQRVLFVIRNDRQREELKRHIDEGNYPGLSYAFHVTNIADQEDLKRLFRNETIRRFIGTNPTFFGYGDTFYFGREIAEAVRRACMLKRTVMIASKERTHPPGTIYTSEQIHDMRQRRQTYSPSLYAMIITPRMLQHLREHPSLRAAAHIPLFSAILDGHRRGIPSEVIHADAINVNWPQHYHSILDRLTEARSWEIGKPLKRRR